MCPAAFSAPALALQHTGGRAHGAWRHTGHATCDGGVFSAALPLHANKTGACVHKKMTGPIPKQLPALMLLKNLRSTLPFQHQPRRH